MIAFIMVVHCISRWGGQMFIVTLVCENFSRNVLNMIMRPSTAWVRCYTEPFSKVRQWI